MVHLVATVKENEQIGALVAWAKVTDDDFDENGEIEILVEPKELFRINAKTDAVETRISFDWEQRRNQLIELVVTACDKGKPPR